jgi:hypothetical protein
MVADRPDWGRGGGRQVSPRQWRDLRCLSRLQRGHRGGLLHTRRKPHGPRQPGPDSRLTSLVLDSLGLMQRSNGMASSTEKRSSRHAVLMVTGAFLGVLACATRDRAPGGAASPVVLSAPSANMGSAATDRAVPDAGSPHGADAGTDRLRPSSAAALDGGVKPSSITSPCVLHAGQGKRQTLTFRPAGAPAKTEAPRGSCSANAECIATQGHETLGDGFVRLDCTDLACACSLEPLPSSRTKPNTSSFELSSPCTTSGQALQLIVERCMPGMVVARH